MKRIIDGVTYNTETSTALAKSIWDDEFENTGILYQTRGGAFFAHVNTLEKRWNEREGESYLQEIDIFEPMSADKAHEWIMTGEVEVFSNPFDDPPEATADTEKGSTIYLRVPISLKQRVDEAAGEMKSSANTWAMRCVEQCLAGFPEQISKIWHIASISRAWTGDSGAEDPHKAETAVRALDEIANLIEDFAKDRFGTDDIAKIDKLALDGRELTDIRNRYKAYPDQ